MTSSSESHDFDAEVPTSKGVGTVPSAPDSQRLQAHPAAMKPTPTKTRLVKAVGDASRARTMARLQRALDSMWMAFQPIVDTTRGTVFGYEALMRNEEGSLSAPGEVLAVAERLGCLRELGRHTRTLAAHAFAHAPPGALLFVNLHTLDLLDPALYEASAPLSKIAGRVVLEITERASLDEIKDLPARLKDLRRHGFRIAIDDLGAGYAGLSSVVSLEPEFVKLDMFLVRNVHECRARQRLIATIMSFRNGLDLNVIAEGVELPEECRQLQGLECRLMQGFLFARPGRPFPVVESFS